MSTRKSASPKTTAEMTGEADLVWASGSSRALASALPACDLLWSLLKIHLHEES